jgi:biopolymer transport protein ExbB
VSTSAGTWFEANGDKAEGQLILMGDIATFGVTDSESVALLPVGEDRLQAWRDGGGETGKKLAAGVSTDQVGVFLHEGRTQRIIDRPPKTLTDILEAGGLVGYVILVLGLIASVLMLMRALVLYGASSGAQKLEKVLASVQRGDVEEATEICAGSRGSAAKVVGRLLPFLDQKREKLEDRASEAVLREMPRTERFGTAILVIAAVAPLLGLLGTVTGMIATFDIITEFGTGDPRMLSGGISSALVTTQFGLIVAIPALLGGNMLAAWGENVLRGAESAALRLLNVDGLGDGHGPAGDEPGDVTSPPPGPRLVTQASH